MKIDAEKRLIECSPTLMVRILQYLLPNDASAQARMERRVLMTSLHEREVFSFTSGAKLMSTNRGNIWRIKFKDPEGCDMLSALSELKSANYSRLAADLMQEAIKHMRGMNNVQSKEHGTSSGLHAEGVGLE